MNPDDIRTWLRSFSDEERNVVRSEVASWDSARRKTNAGGRPKVLRPCPKCGAVLGARELQRGHKCPTA